MLTLSIILTVVIVTSFFIIRNLLKQTEKLEDILKGYEDFIEKQSEAIIAIETIIKISNQPICGINYSLLELFES